jgi:hypothetical protein
MYQGPRNVVVTGLLGALLTWLTIVTGTLLPAIVVHIALDLRVVFLPSSVTEPYEPTELVPRVTAPERAGWIHIAAGTIVIVGSLADWLSLSTRFGLTVTQNAFQLSGRSSVSVDGFVLVACGALLILVGAQTVQGRARVNQRAIGALLSLLVFLVALNRWSGLHAVVSRDSSLPVTASIGVGYYLVLVGGVVGVAASIVVRQRAHHLQAPQKSASGTPAASLGNPASE